MIKTNDLDEYSFLNSIKSCCKNYECVCDECPLSKICMFANINMSKLNLVFDAESKNEENSIMKMQSCDNLPKQLEVVLLQYKNELGRSMRKLACLEGEQWYDEYSGLVIPKESVEAWSALPPIYKKNG